MEHWDVLIKDRVPAYIPWEQYERNLAQLQSNTAQSGGVVRNGPSLLSGLVVCGRCGLRMATRYNNNCRGLRYTCSRMAVDYGEPLCQSLAGEVLDEEVRRLVFAALQPAALDISLQVAEDLEGERARQRQQWEQRLQRARYEAQRAERQYQAVEPEHRLVARTLEQQWEAALQAQAAMQNDYERFLAAQPSPLSAAERARIRRLASDIPALWHAATTTAADRQAIVRQLIERVIVTVLDDSERVNLEVHWAGGHRTRARIIRPVARLQQLSYYPQLLARVMTLHEQGMACTEIARQLNAEQWRPAKRRNTFTGPMVATLLARQGLHSGTPKQQHTGDVPRHPHEWLLGDLARKLDMPSVTLFSWVRKQWVRARQVSHRGRDIWLIWADETECERLRARRQQPRRWARHIRVGDPASTGNTA
jgi:hypothetical protein